MSGPFSGPPSLSQERIHGVTANLSRMYPRHGNLQRLNLKYSRRYLRAIIWLDDEERFDFGVLSCEHGHVGAEHVVLFGQDPCPRVEVVFVGEELSHLVQ